MKKNLTKKLIALLSTVAILGTLFTVPASADGVLPDRQEASAGLTEAKAVPDSGPRDIDTDPRYADKSVKARKVAADIILGIGEAIIPFGSTVRNVIKYNSKSRDGATGADLAISIITDTASYVFPLAAPAVTVAKDITEKVRDLIRPAPDTAPV